MSAESLCNEYNSVGFGSWDDTLAKKLKQLQLGTANNIAETEADVPELREDVVHGIYELSCHVPERQRAYVAIEVAMGVRTSSWEALSVYRRLSEMVFEHLEVHEMK